MICIIEKFWKFRPNRKCDIFSSTLLKSAPHKNKSCSHTINLQFYVDRRYGMENLNRLS